MATPPNDFALYCCMNYYSAPDDAMESPPLMSAWARLALEAALKARQSKPAARRLSKKKS